MSNDAINNPSAATNEPTETTMKEIVKQTNVTESPAETTPPAETTSPAETRPAAENTFLDALESAGADARPSAGAGVSSDAGTGVSAGESAIEGAFVSSDAGADVTAGEGAYEGAKESAANPVLGNKVGDPTDETDRMHPRGRGRRGLKMSKEQLMAASRTSWGMFRAMPS